MIVRAVHSGRSDKKYWALTADLIQNCSTSRSEGEKTFRHVPHITAALSELDAARLVACSLTRCVCKARDSVPAWISL
jgi:hypothetical protein